MLYLYRCRCRVLWRISTGRPLFGTTIEGSLYQYCEDYSTQWRINIIAVFWNSADADEPHFCQPRRHGFVVYIDQLIGAAALRGGWAKVVCDNGKCFSSPQLSRRAQGRQWVYLYKVRLLTRPASACIQYEGVKRVFPSCERCSSASFVSASFPLFLVVFRGVALAEPKVEVK